MFPDREVATKHDQLTQLESRPHLSAIVRQGNASLTSVAVAYACDAITIRSVSAASAYGLIALESIACSGLLTGELREP